MIGIEPLKVVRAAEIEERPPEQHWLIEALWADGAVGLLGGTPKSCKSWLGLEIATSVATATPCLDRFPVRQKGAALIYLAEDSLSIVRERLAALAQHRRLTLDALDLHVIVATSLRLDLEVDSARLTATVVKLRPRLVLLDPFVRLHRADENSAQEIATILARLREIQRLQETAILVVHHTRKHAPGAQPGLALRGSGDLWAWGDSNLYLTHEQGMLKLTAEHRAAPAPDPLYLALAPNPPHLTIRPPPAGKTASLEARILEALHNAGSAQRRGELRAKLGVNNQRLGEALDKLHAAGDVQKTAEGWSI